MESLDSPIAHVLIRSDVVSIVSILNRDERDDVPTGHMIPADPLYVEPLIRRISRRVEIDILVHSRPLGPRDIPNPYLPVGDKRLRRVRFAGCVPETKTDFHVVGYRQYLRRILQYRFIQPGPSPFHDLAEDNVSI